MKIQTISLVAGTDACNARCPFCIAGMTSDHDLGTKPKDINTNNLGKALMLAEISGVTTALITGKGEPTLFPDHIKQYIRSLATYKIPFVELQTNGIAIADGKVTDEMLEDWRIWGLNTIIISVVGFYPEKNRQVYLPHRKEYIDLEALIAKLHKIGFTVRLGVVAVKGGIDDPDKMDQMINFAQVNKVEQLTIRPVTKADAGTTKDFGINNYVTQNGISKDDWDYATYRIRNHGHLLMKLVHGAAVYDVDGQNICISTCLTLDPNEEKIRQIIFFPNGRLTYDWQYEGAVLL